MVTKKCLYCWVEFEAKNNSKNFCCISHRAKHWRSNKQILTKKCWYCSNVFETKNEDQRFCCEKCHDKWHWNNKSLIKKECKNCWKEFETKNKRTAFCSLKCSSNYNISKVQKTCINKYWVKAPLQLKKFLSKKDKTCLNKYWSECVMSLDEFKEKQQQTILERYWKKTYFLTDNFPKHTVISKKNIKRAEFIHKATWLEVEYEFRWIEWYSYDLRVWKFLIEIDPIVTHNSSKSFLKWSKPINKYYHQKKSLAAEQVWYHCIHLFDWDDNDTVKEWLIWLMTNRKRLYHWELRKVNWKEAEKFYDENHLQGRCSASVHYWLYVKDKLINCISFTCFKWEWQLVRFASLKWYRIAHWAEKLFKAFIDEYDPDYIVSFSDITKHSWWLYNALWFELEKINEPSYWRANKTWTKVYWRRYCQKQNMYKLEWFDPNYKYLEHKDDQFWQQTEAEIMESKWYLRIFDSWMRKHIRKKPVN